MRIAMTYFDKINIYVPENVGKTLENDAMLFEIFKKDGRSINKNRLLSMLICGYYNSYMEGKRYKLMTSDSDKWNFADSIIGSEWYYKQCTTVGALELTGIVVGYLKSVEQLLYTLLMNWSGREIWIELNEDNNKYIDKTLGGLIRLIKQKNNGRTFKHGNMFCVNDETLQCIIDETILEEQIIEWATPIIKFDIPQKANVIAFDIIKFEGMPWCLAIQALSQTDHVKYSTIEWNHNSIYTSTITNNVIEWNSEEIWADEIDKIKRIIGRMLETGDVADILKNFSEVILGSFEVIEVLYSK